MRLRNERKRMEVDRWIRRHHAAEVRRDENVLRDHDDVEHGHTEDLTDTALLKIIMKRLVVKVYAS